MNDHRYAVATSAEYGEDRQVVIQWADTSFSRFHYIWLRQQHFHPAFGRDKVPTSVSQPRLPDAVEQLQIRTIQLIDGRLVIDWQHDDSRTTHELQWLRDNAYDTLAVRQRKHQPTLWLGKDAERFNWHDFADVMTHDEALWQVYEAVIDHGFARLNNAPADTNVVSQLAQRFGPIRVTDFGAISDIASRPIEDAGRYANIGAGGYQTLGPHTDEGWRYSPPGINFHLCLQSTPESGGDSLLYDGFLAAARLRINNPQAYDFLTRTAFKFAAARNDNERYFAYGKLLCEDNTGELVGVRFSDRTMGHQDLPPDLIEPAYMALRAFTEELYKPDLTYRHTLMPGECHIFDNHRILHGRCAFNPQLGPRHLQQCSVDREEFHNRLRLLAGKLNQPKYASLILGVGALT